MTLPAYTTQRNERTNLPATVDLVVTWMKTRTLVTAICGQRISTSLPKRDEDITYPWLTIGSVVGIPALPEAAIDRARLQFNAWGGVKANGAPNWKPANDLLLATEMELRTLLSAHVPNKGFIMGTGQLQGIQQLEDPDDGSARFWMDFIVVARSE
jgi:hypothetical protein